MRKNKFREQIIAEDLLQYIDDMPISGRNKSIVIAYAEGASYKDLSAKFSVSPERIRKIIFTYIWHIRGGHL